MRQLRGRPRLYDLNRRRSGLGQGLEAVSASARVSCIGALETLEDLLLDVTSDGESELDAFNLYSIDPQGSPQ